MLQTIKAFSNLSTQRFGCVKAQKQLGQEKIVVMVERNQRWLLVANGKQTEMDTTFCSQSHNAMHHDL